MFSSDEWWCHAMLRHPVVSRHMPLDWTLAKTTLEWKPRLFRRRRATPVLISLATATPVISFLVVFFCFVLSASLQFLLLRAFSATWKTPIGLPRQGPSGEAFIGAQQEISENSGFGVSAASSGKHGNTSATSDTDILKVWHVYKTKKGGKKTDLSNAVYRRAQYHLVCHGPEAACRLPLVPTILIQNGCHGGQVYHQHLCNNYLSLHAKFWLIFPCQLMLSKLILLFNLFPTKRE